jgi:hypothetical protein
MIAVSFVLEMDFKINRFALNNLRSYLIVKNSHTHLIYVKSKQITIFMMMINSEKKAKLLGVANGQTWIQLSDYCHYNLKHDCF